MTKHPNPATFRYALVNRPADIGTIPRGLEYSVEPRPAAGEPHHDMARHGVLVTPRELTLDEVRSFELAPLIDEQGLDAMAARIAGGRMGDYPAEYVEVNHEEPATFRAGVMQALGRVDKGVRYSICDSELLAALVCKKLEASVFVGHQAGPAVAPRDQ